MDCYAEISFNVRSGRYSLSNKINTWRTHLIKNYIQLMSLFTKAILSSDSKPRQINVCYCARLTIIEYDFWINQLSFKVLEHTIKMDKLKVYLHKSVLKFGVMQSEGRNWNPNNSFPMQVSALVAWTTWTTWPPSSPTWLRFSTATKETANWAQTLTKRYQSIFILLNLVIIWFD